MVVYIYPHSCSTITQKSSPRGENNTACTIFLISTAAPKSFILRTCSGRDRGIWETRSAIPLSNNRTQGRTGMSRNLLGFSVVPLWIAVVSTPCKFRIISILMSPHKFSTPTHQGNISQNPVRIILAIQRLRIHDGHGPCC